MRPAALGLLALAALAVPAAAQVRTGTIDPRTSTLAYSGHHRLHEWTGRSRDVRGTVAFDPAVPGGARVTITVPVESFDSGNASRDSNMMDEVNVDDHPDVRFVSDRVEVLSWAPVAGGHRGEWRVFGHLTFHGQTRPVALPVTVTLNGAAFEAHAAFPLSLATYGVRRPKLMGIQIDDALTLEGTFRATLR